MSEELQKIEELEKEIRRLKGLDNNTIPTYSFSKIRDIELNNLFNIEKKINNRLFDDWFNSKIEIEEKKEHVLKEIISENSALIADYNEEDLKINVIAPLLGLVKFKSFENEFRDFYELPLCYKTDRFILNGTTDFVVSKGLFKSKKPYFFIQEFKRAEEFSNPRPQLLAELISALELNNEEMMKGAYIVGENWNFVILEKLGVDSYQYVVSRTFNCTNIEDLKDIYKHLVFVKNEIVSSICGEDLKQNMKGEKE